MIFLKNNIRTIIGFIVGVILASSITVYAYNYIASDISYTKPGTETAISVEEALNELYSKSNKTAQQVGTLTTNKASYTFKNDGYIIGTVKASDNKSGYVRIDEVTVLKVHFDDTETTNASIYVTKGSTVTTSAKGIHNLTLYEFK